MLSKWKTQPLETLCDPERKIAYGILKVGEFTADGIPVITIQDAVDDGATVEIFYESRLAKLDINSAEIERLSAEVEEVVEDEEDIAQREKTKGLWSTLEKLVGAKERVEEVAADLAQHFEARISVIEGKAMNLDIFWLKDHALEEGANLSAPGVIAADIVADLEATLEQLSAIEEDLQE